MPKTSTEPIEVKAVRDLLHKVPGPPGEALPGGVSDADLRAFSERTGIEIPAPLSTWLKLSNGPCVGPGGLFGIRPARADLDIERCFERYPQWKERAWIPVAGDGCGNSYVLATAQEFGPGWPVLFIETLPSPQEPACIVASDLWRFLVFLLEREFFREKGIRDTPWPFDRTEVTRRDPEIESYKDVPMPWESD